MNKIEKALIFATKAHEGQVRKYTGEPYIFHPMEVAGMMKNYVDDEDMLSAAILHDTVEDTDATIEDIEREFGGLVASYVAGLTDVSKPEDGNRKARKDIDLQHIANQSLEVKVIKLFDLISNSKSIKKHDPKFWEVYKKEKLALLDVMEFEVKDSLIQMARSYINVQ